MSRAPLIVVLALIAAGSGFVALLFGSLQLSLAQVFASIVDPSPGVAADVIWKLRLPRVLAAFACGGLLATSGVLLQPPLLVARAIGTSVTPLERQRTTPQQWRGRAKT